MSVGDSTFIKENVCWLDQVQLSLTLNSEQLRTKQSAVTILLAPLAQALKPTNGGSNNPLRLSQLSVFQDGVVVQKITRHRHAQLSSGRRVKSISCISVDRRAVAQHRLLTPHDKQVLSNESLLHDMVVGS